jgi:ATP-dependent DNA helicase RecG
LNVCNERYGRLLYNNCIDDRVEIESPGSLPLGIDKKTFGKASIRRNPILADLFHRMGNVERMGSGIKTMRDLMKNAGLQKPASEMDLELSFTAILNIRFSRLFLNKGGILTWIMLSFYDTRTTR